ncbi:MAG: hypothetical protein ACR2JF_00525 [Iamia sp.]
MPGPCGARAGTANSGETVRKLIDCLIAAVAIRADAPVHHADVDFTSLARHTALRVWEESSDAGR